MGNKIHKTKDVGIKTADVDIDIEPVVNWLNSYDGVLTEFSCQGDTVQWSPYVCFYCQYYDLLREILKITEKFSEIPKKIGTCYNVMGGTCCHIDFIGDTLPFRYDLRFYDSKILRMFVKYLDGTCSHRLKSRGRIIKLR